MKKVNKSFFLIVSSFIFSCNSESFKEDTSNFVEAGDHTIAIYDTSPKSRVQEILEDGKVVINAGKELLNEKRKNDSIKLSRREKMFAYQLGLPIKNEKLLMEAYKKLSSTQDIYAFKRDKNEYLLVKYEDLPREELELGLEAYRNLHANEVIGAIKIIDLAWECGKRKMPVLTYKIKMRKDTTQINCLTCQN